MLALITFSDIFPAKMEHGMVRTKQSLDLSVWQRTLHLTRYIDPGLT